jgi:hypothetical protein
MFMSACTERAICPAYQSAYIYDKTELQKRFSYFTPDSVPKVMTASKNRYHVIEKMPYKQKVRSLNTIPMKPVYPVLVDTLNMTYVEDDPLALAERDQLDSAAAARPGFKSTYQYKWNVDQYNYVYYFNEILVYPHERAQKEAERAGTTATDVGTAKKKGLFSFLKRDKSSRIDPETGEKLPRQKKEKQPKVKKEKQPKAPKEVPVEPEETPKEEEEDDGF